MNKLMSELTRLYLPPGAQAQCGTVDLVAADGATRAIAIPFRKVAGDEAGHWERLCALANTLQQELGFPAPAVSVASAGGYVLWLSLAQPVALDEVRRFVDLLARAHPELALSAAAVGVPLELPPCADAASGKWAAFIHPGMGASFADESGLDMAPPAAGQVAFLDGLDSIDAVQWRAAIAQLAPAPAAAPATTPACADGLLLKDATLDDIVRFLHARNIEPTFRHLLPRD